MHSRATDRRSASKCQGKWPDQTLDQAFGLSEVLVAVSTSRLSCKRAGKTRTLMPVWDSSGESRFYSACLNKQHRAVSHSIPRAPTPEVPPLLAHETRQHHVVHFGGAVDEARLTGVAIDPFQNRVLGIAARAVELNRDIGRLMQRIGDVKLGHGDFLARTVALIELPSRVHH